VALIIDCSGSMSKVGPKGSKLEEVKEAAAGFVRRQDLSKHQIAVVGFGSSVHLGVALTQDPRALESAIAGLADGGGTRMALGLRAGIDQLRQSPLERNILLFTDGKPDSAQETSRVADTIRAQRIRVVAVATSDADAKFLARVTADAALVFPATAGRFGEAFEEAEEVIYGASLVELERATPASTLLRVGGWTAFLAVGVAMLLILGQNSYLRRRLMTLREGSVGTVGGMLSGAIAGVAGQALLLSATRGPPLELLGRVGGWTLLGLLVGAGMAHLIPNLRLWLGLLGGGLGGLLGVFGFLAATYGTGDLGGRLVGASLLGFCLGLMIAFVEATFRRAWLEVQWGPKEQSTISLGQEPIILGSGPESHVYLQGQPPVAGSITLYSDRLLYEDKTTGKSVKLKDGSKRQRGKLTMIVRTKK
jgi:Ca-activated chloride channel family protein